MKTAKIFLLIFLTLLISIGFALYKTYAAETIKIGVILPLAGGSSIAGLEVLSGIVTAQEEINAAGGCRRPPY